MPEAERHTKVLTNVWANQVFKCLAYVDATWHAEKVIKSKIVYQVIHFEEKPNYQNQTKWYPFEKVIPNIIKKLGYLPNWLESLSVSLNIVSRSNLDEHCKLLNYGSMFTVNQFQLYKHLKQSKLPKLF